MGAEGILVPGQLGTVEVTYGEVGEDMGRGSGEEEEEEEQEGRCSRCRSWPLLPYVQVHGQVAHGFSPRYLPTNERTCKTGTGTHSKERVLHAIPYHTIPYHTIQYPKRPLIVAQLPPAAQRAGWRGGPGQGHSPTYLTYLTSPARAPGTRSRSRAPYFLMHAPHDIAPIQRGTVQVGRRCRIWQLCAWAERDDVPG